MKYFVYGYFVENKARKDNYIIIDDSGNLKNRKEPHNGDLVLMEPEDVNYVLEKLRLLPLSDNQVVECQHIFDYVCNNVTNL